MNGHGPAPTLPFRLPALLVALLTLGAGPASGAQTRAFVAATDFGSGNLASIAFGPPRAVSPNVAGTSSDAVLRWHQGLLYVVNRSSASNVQVLDPANNFALVHQTSVGSGSNPHDIVVVSPTRAYVSRYDASDLWIINPQNGQFLGSVSLAGFADADGIPEMDRMAMRHGRLFVTVQRLDRNNFYIPAGGSLVAVIDLAADTLVDMSPAAPGVQGIPLPFQNPFTEVVVDGDGQLVVGCAGSFGVADGGIVRIDPVTGSVATEITEAALGGDVNDVAVLDSQRGFAVISDASFNTILRAYRRDLGTASGTVVASSGFFLADCEVNDRGELWVCDRDFAGPGVRVFDALTHSELTASPLDTGLPPQDIEFDGAITTGVPSAAATPGPLSIAAIAPNPGRGAVEIAFTVGERTATLPDVATAVVADAAGRTVRTLERPIAGSGRHAFEWDGRDGEHRLVRAGVYFVRIRFAGAETSGTVIRLP